jgi:hypothetical protein
VTLARRRHNTVLAAVLAGCATAPPPSDAPPIVLPDLGPSTRPPRTAPGTAATAATGESVSVRLDPERTAVTALVSDYLRALAARDLDAALAACDDAVGGVLSASPAPLGAMSQPVLRARHEQLVAELSRLGDPTPRVWSWAECVARGGCAPAQRPGDWYCDWDTPAAAPRAAVPRSALVRVVEGRARIVGLTDAFLTGRR